MLIWFVDNLLAHFQCEIIYMANKKSTTNTLTHTHIKNTLRVKHINSRMIIKSVHELKKETKSIDRFWDAFKNNIHSVKM